MLFSVEALLAGGDGVTALSFLDSSALKLSLELQFIEQQLWLDTGDMKIPPVVDGGLAVVEGDCEEDCDVEEIPGLKSGASGFSFGLRDDVGAFELTGVWNSPDTGASGGANASDNDGGTPT